MAVGYESVHCGHNGRAVMAVLTQYDSGILYLKIKDPWQPNIGTDYSLSYEVLVKETGLYDGNVPVTRYWDGITVQSNPYEADTKEWLW